jgi:hypothetical protein
MSVDQLVQTAVEFLTKTPTPNGFMRLAVTLAQEVNSIKVLAGNEKKAVVLDILKQAVQKCPVPEAQKTELLDLLKTVVPATLDIAVSVARGGFSLAKPKVGCFASLFRCFLANVPIDPKLKEMASGAVDKAEQVAKAVEAGESVKAVVLELVAPVAPVAPVEAVDVKAVTFADVTVVPAIVEVKTVGVDEPPTFGILISMPADASQPASVQITGSPSHEVSAATKEDLKEEPKTEAVQDWGASK